MQHSFLIDVQIKTNQFCISKNTPKRAHQATTFDLSDDFFFCTMSMRSMENSAKPLGLPKPIYIVEYALNLIKMLEPPKGWHILKYGDFGDAGRRVSYRSIATWILTHSLRVASWTLILVLPATPKGVTCEIIGHWQCANIKSPKCPAVRGDFPRGITQIVARCSGNTPLTHDNKLVKQHTKWAQNSLRWRSWYIGTWLCILWGDRKQTF